MTCVVSTTLIPIQTYIGEAGGPPKTISMDSYRSAYITTTHVTNIISLTVIFYYYIFMWFHV